MATEVVSRSKSRTWQGFWQLADPKVWVASTVPMVVAAALAYRDLGFVHLGWLLAVAIGVYLIEIGKNAVNEVVDFQSGADRFVAPEDRTPFSGGKKTLTEGRLTTGEATAIAVVTLALAAALGVFIAWQREPTALWVGLAGLFAAIAYSAPPLKLAYRGLGELTVGLTFGPLLCVGTYLVLTGAWSGDAALLGAVLGIIIANVLWINEFPDYHADRMAGKMNGVARLGRRRAVAVHALLYAAAYVALCVSAYITGNTAWLFGLVSAPKAAQSVRIAARHYDHTQELTAANAMTIEVYRLTGLALALAAVVQALG